MIGFVGLSHLGLNYSLATAAKGFDVVAYDPDAMVTARCAAGEFPIEEPGFGELFAQHRDRIRYTSDETALAECELVFYSLDVRHQRQQRKRPRPSHRTHPRDRAKAFTGHDCSRSQSGCAWLHAASSGRNSARFRPPTSTTKSRR